MCSCGGVPVGSSQTAAALEAQRRADEARAQAAADAARSSQSAAVSNASGQ